MKKTALCLALVLALVISLASCDMLGDIIGGDHTHASENWIVETEPTCTSEGSRYLKCDECDEIMLTEKLEKLPHTPETVPGKEATDTEDGMTEGTRCSVCGETITAGENIPASISGVDISIPDFEREGDTLRIRLASRITALSLAGVIKVNSAAELSVSYDAEGNNAADLENIALNPGDNTLYVTVTLGEESKTYTVVIRRALTCNVSFVLDDGSVLATATVDEGETAVLPDLEREGYTLVSDFDFTTPITADTEIEVKWIGNGPAYKVNYYFEELDGTYTLEDEVTEYGFNAGETVTAAQKDRDGFEFYPHLSKTSGELLADGSLVLSVYYRRCVYSVYADGGVNSALLAGAGEYKYGAEVSVSTPYVPLGFDFLGWYSGEEKLSDELEYSFTVSADVVAVFAVKEAIAPYIFISNDTECIITGVLTTDATSLTIPAYVTEVASLAFSECTALTDLTVLGAETVIAADAFLGCPIERATAPAGALHALPKARITELTVNGGGEIASSAMQGSKRLAILVIGDGVTEIGESAFAGLRNLVSVTLGRDVALINDAAFANTPKLREVVNLSSLTLYNNNDNGGVARYAWIIGTAESVIERRDGFLFLEYERQQGNTIVTDRYLMAYVGQDTELVLPESPNNFRYTLHNYALADLAEVKSISVPEIVDFVYTEAVFNGCSSLESLSIPCHAGEMPSNDPDEQSLGTLFGSESYENSTSFTKNMGAYYNTFYIPSGLKNLTIVGYDHSNRYIAQGYMMGIPVIENVAIVSYVSGGTIRMDVGMSAFADCPDLVSVEIEGFVIINENVFASCPSLLTVFGESASADIGKTVFKNCTALKNVDLKCATVGESAFSGCTALESVIIPTALAIRKSAFEGCTALKTAEIGETQYIEERAFYGCTSLTEYKLPENLNEIGAYAFASCHSLESISFADCKYLAATGEYSFSGCTSLKSVTFGNYITELASNTFRYCTSLESITIPANLVTIGSYAFSYCTSLAEVVTEGAHVFKTDVFKECNGIKRFYTPSLEVWLSNTFGDGILKGADLYVGTELLTEFVLPSNLTTITNSAFEGCGSLTKVTLPAHATWFGISIFAECENLKEAVIEEGVTEIPAIAFNVCSSLDTINIPSTVKTIQSFSFGSCTSLSSINIPDSVTEIGEKAFDGSALTEITIPGSVATISKCAFRNCKLLKKVTLGEGVSKIVDSAFSGCTSLESISIPASMSKVNSNAFSNCSGIDVYAVSLSEWLGISFSSSEANPLVSGGKLYFGGVLAEELDITGIQALSMYAFEGAVSIKSVTVRADVQTIGVFAFSGCTNLASIIIEEGVTSIGYYAFNNCSSLKEIYLPSSATLGTSPFAGCTSLERAVLGNSVPSFSGCTALKEVVILEGVTEMALANLSGCTSLESIVIPASMTTMTMLPVTPYKPYLALVNFYKGLNLSVYYCGESIDDYNAITNSSILEKAEELYVYSPDEPVSAGRFWHYDSDGKIAVWPEYVG